MANLYFGSDKNDTVNQIQALAFFRKLGEQMSHWQGVESSPTRDSVGSWAGTWL